MKEKEKEKKISELSLFQMEELLLSTSDVKILYELELELGKKVTALHKMIHSVNYNDEVERNQIRGNLSWATDMKSIANKKQEDMRNEANKFNRNFRIVAQKKLNQKLYNELCEEAKI